MRNYFFILLFFYSLNSHSTISYLETLRFSSKNFNDADIIKVSKLCEKFQDNNKSKSFRLESQQVIDIKRSLIPLEIFTLSENYNSLYKNLISNLPSNAGKLIIANKLSNPLKSSTEIKKQIEIVFFLVSNPEALAEIELMLSEYKRVEEAILTFFTRNSYEIQHIIQHTNGPSKKARWEKFRNRVFTLLLPLKVYNLYWSNIMFYRELKFDPTLDTNKFFKGLSAFISWTDLFLHVTDQLNEYEKSKEYFNVIKSDLKSFSELFGLMHKYQAITQSDDIFMNLKFYGIVDFYNESFHKNDHDEFGSTFNSAYKKLYLEKEKFFKSEFNINPVNFIYSLNSKATILYDKMYSDNNNRPFFILLEAMGELDSFVSTAKHIIATQNKRVRYSIPQLIESDAPSISGEALWSPLISQKKVVTNNAEFNKDRKTVIITGANTGGKSTYIHSVFSNLVLSQSIGISSANQFNFTPFSAIHTSQNVSSSLSKGQSLFKAQILDIKTMFTSFKFLDENEFSISFIDEMLTGTASTYGSYAAEKIINKLTNNQNNITLYASHFPNIVSMSDSNPVIHNVSFDASIDDYGNIITDYRLKEGAAKGGSNIALPLLQHDLNSVGIDFISDFK